MSEQYRIGKYTFSDEKEYKIAKMEIEFILSINGKYSVNYENALKINYALQTHNITFQSEVGKNYKKKIDKCIYLHEQEVARKEAARKEAEEKRRAIARKEAEEKQLKEIQIKKKRYKRNTVLFSVIFGCLFGVVALYFFSNIYSFYSSTNKLKKLQTRVQVTKVIPVSGNVIEDTGSLGSVKSLLPEYEDLYNENNDLAGWLYIDDTVINYPIMQLEEDNSYYLSHDFDKKNDKNGLLVLDYRCDTDKKNGNILIHGHNMTSGLMFGSLKKYESLDYFYNHRYIQFDTVYQKYTYEVMAVFRSKVYNKGEDVFKYYNNLEFDSQQDYDYFINNINELKLYDTKVKSSYGDTFLMLSTCDYSDENGRLVVIAKRED